MEAHALGANSGEHEMTEILTLSVPEAGRRYFGLSRNGSYAAAERGELPTIKIGRLLRVPVRALERMLDQAAPTAA
jgi:Helix-turn-helix domain